MVIINKARVRIMDVETSDDETIVISQNAVTYKKNKITVILRRVPYFVEDFQGVIEFARDFSSGLQEYVDECNFDKGQAMIDKNINIKFEKGSYKLSIVFDDYNIAIFVRGNDLLYKIPTDGYEEITASTFKEVLKEHGLERLCI